jgi:hypothetical protein
MSANRFLPPTVRLSQAFEPEKFSGGAGASEITRRSFLKRTGGATVATLVAWNLASQEIRAAHAFTSDSSPKWKIRSRAVGSTVVPIKEGLGNPEDWTHNNVTYPVKRSLQLFASAPDNPPDSPPGTHKYANSATCSVTIKLRRWASIKLTANSDFVPMSDQNYNDWPGSANWKGAIPASAILTQQIYDPSALEPTLTITGIAPQTEAERSHSDLDMSLYVWWEGEKLHFDFSSVPGVQSTSGELESIWEFHTD